MARRKRNKVQGENISLNENLNSNENISSKEDEIINKIIESNEEEELQLTNTAEVSENLDQEDKVDSQPEIIKEENKKEKEKNHKNTIKEELNNKKTLVGKIIHVLPYHRYMVKTSEGNFVINSLKAYNKDDEIEINFS